jgi:hypothetical protein
MLEKLHTKQQVNLRNVYPKKHFNFLFRVRNFFIKKSSTNVSNKNTTT